MKNNEKKTFADRANHIRKQYRRLEFDNIERDQFQRDMDDLMMEQEAVRKAKGLIPPPEDSQMPQQAPPPPPPPQGQQGMVDPSAMVGMQPSPQLPGQEVPGITEDPIAYAYGGSKRDMYSNGEYKKGYETGNSGFWASMSGNKFAGISEADFAALSEEEQAKYASQFDDAARRTQEFKSDSVPALIGGGLSMAGNLYSAIRARNAADENLIDPVLTRHSDVNLRPIETTLRNEAITSRNIAQRNLRNAARTRGEYMAGINVNSAQSQGTLASALSNLYLQEAAMNQQGRARVDALNAQAINNANAINAQRRDRLMAEADNATASLFETPAMVMRDIRAAKQQRLRDEMIYKGFNPTVVDMLLEQLGKK